MREHNRKNRKASEPVFEISVNIPGLAQTTDGKSDRFRCSAETRDSKLLAERRHMIVDLGRRLLHDVLAARMRGEFTTEELAHAYKKGGEAALEKLVVSSRTRILTDFVEDWSASCRAASRSAFRRHVELFVAFCSRTGPATTFDLTSTRITEWLDTLTDGRRNSGRHATSTNSQAVRARARREKKKMRGGLAEAVQPVKIKPSTWNSHRASISSFCTYLVDVAKVLDVHPLTEGKHQPKDDVAERLPYLKPEEWNAYLHTLSANPLAPKESVTIARILRHTGADVGEVLGYYSGGTYVPGMRPCDLHMDRELPRIRFKRHKVTKSPERLIPYPGFMTELTELVTELGTLPTEEIFAHVDRGQFERAHRRAASIIGHPGLTLKDLRHLAAIAWAEADVRLEKIVEWLGHLRVDQTLTYAAFRPSDAGDAPGVLRAIQIATGG